MDEARDQGSAGNDSVPPSFARLIGQPAPAFSLGGLQGATVPPVDAPAGGAWLLIDPQGVVRKGAVGTQGLEQVLAPERKD